MAVGRDGRQESGLLEPERLACAVLQKIKGRDLPGGMFLKPDNLAPVLQASVADVRAALKLLEERGATVRAGDGWMVRSDRRMPQRDFLMRIHPLMGNLVRLAATNITPEQAAAVADAYDRFYLPSSGLDTAGRSEAYREMLMLIAEATGSAFHQTAVTRALKEAGPLVDMIVADVMRLPLEHDPDDELARLVNALKAGDVVNAVQAVEDHVLVVGVRMDRLF